MQNSFFKFSRSCIGDTYRSSPTSVFVKTTNGGGLLFYLMERFESVLFPAKSRQVVSHRYDDF